MDSNEKLDIPSEFLKNVIDGVVKEQRIKDYTMIVSSASAKGENYVGVLMRVKVSGFKENGERAELSLILKIPPQSEAMRANFPVESAYIKEVFVYDTILPEFCALEERYNVPKAERFQRIKCFKGDSEQFKEFLVLEDMSVKGFRMADRRKTLQLQHLKLALKSLATFHSLSFAFKKLHPERFLELASESRGHIDMLSLAPFVKIARDRALSVIDDPNLLKKATSFTEDIMGKLTFFYDPKSVEPYSVLSHGDSWVNNMLFKFEGDEPVDVRLLDWQVCRHCSPIVDITYFIFSSTDYDTRKEHLSYLQDYYYQCMTQSLLFMDCDIRDHFPRAVYDEHWRLMLPHGLIMAMLLLPAICGESEDAPDMDEIFQREDLSAADFTFDKEETTVRFSSRMKGVVQTLLDLDML